MYDWTADGKELLLTQGGPAALWRMPVAGAPHAETTARKIASSPDFDLWQPHLSPDRRWIVFEGIARSREEWSESAIYVTPATGGPWTRITDGKRWDDKPNWSPDGRFIYFVSGRGGGFFNVWGIRFDSSKGVALGEPFQVTHLDSPELMVPQAIPQVELSLTRDRLVLTTAQVSGHIWVLDNVDR